MKSVLTGMLWPLMLAIFLSIIYLWQITAQVDPGRFGLMARDWSSWTGIFTCAFFHGSIDHLFNNVISFLPLSSLLFILYKPKGAMVLFWCWIITGLLMFFFARGGVSHIGVSGVIYAECAFLVTAGLLLPSRGLKMISVLVLVFYGSMVWGILPLEKKVSWDGHLCGLVTGVFLAYLYRAKFKSKHEDAKPDWVEEDLSDNNDEYSRFGK